MSAPHVSWALRVRKLKPAQRLVLCAIAERANGDLACWPSVSLIADDVELTRRAVFLAIDYLENERQLIRKVTGDEREDLLAKGHFKGDPRVNVYRLNKNEVTDDGEHSSPINGYVGELSSLRPPPLSELSSPIAPSRLVNTVHPLGELSSPESPIESPIEKDTGLRPGATAAPPAEDKPPDATKILYDEGLPILRNLTGRSRDACAKLLGRLRRDHGDDCAAVLTALHRAREMHPVQAMAFLQGALKAAKRETMADMQARVLAELDAAGSA
jgi:hypothetical protein